MEPNVIKPVTTDQPNQPQADTEHPYATAEPTPAWVLQKTSAQDLSLLNLIKAALKALLYGILWSMPMLAVILVYGIMHIGNPYTQAEQRVVDIMGILYLISYAIAAAVAFYRLTKLPIVRAVLSFTISFCIAMLAGNIFLTAVTGGPDSASTNNDDLEVLGIVIIVGITSLLAAVFTRINLRSN